MEASSDQISAFTHWYYWTMNIGIGIQAMVVMGGHFYAFGQCTLPAKSALSYKRNRWDGTQIAFTAAIIVVMLVIQTVSVLALLASLYKLKKHLTIEPAGHNPFTTSTRC